MSFLNQYGHISGFFVYFVENIYQVAFRLIQHINLTLISVMFAILIGVPLGLLVSYIRKVSKPILMTANIIQAIPSMALLGFLVPLVGIGETPATITVVLYSLLPIIKNTYAGLSSISPDIIESARGIGLTRKQILTKIQIPLALPVIMTGVRISAVTAVGLMTLASYIGAGGLGFLILSGVRTVNNYQLLSGAIPACMLALLVDFLFGIVEKIVTPISLQLGKSKKNLSKKDYIRRRKIVFACFGTILALMIASPIISSFSEKTEKTITIGSKDFNEQQIFLHMFADYIEKETDITVIRKPALGSTQIIFEALQKGDIDMYVEYTGTAFVSVLKNPSSSDSDFVYEEVKRDYKELYDIEVLEQIPVNNTYVLAITKDTADKYNLKTISDLANVGSHIITGTGLEFINREDGLKGVTEAYNFKFKDSIALDLSQKYIALVQDQVQAVDAFATDGLLKKFDLIKLEDDKSFFPPYYAIPLLRSDTYQEYPELEEVINILGAVLNDDIMAELNYKADEGTAPADAAREFLIEKGLY